MPIYILATKDNQGTDLPRKPSGITKSNNKTLRHENDTGALMTLNSCTRK